MVERKIRVGAVSYLNTKPMLSGLESGPLSDQIELLLDFPAGLAALLQKGELDIGLLPVGALHELGDYSIITNCCIGTTGEVASVAVFSDVPMHEIKTVILDYQSRTSVLLCQILFRKLWKKKVQFIKANDEHYLQEIGGNTAGLIIGDRALQRRSNSKYIYDLGEGWKQLTGLPFVFAVWVTKQKFDEDFLLLFNEGVEQGIEQLATKVPLSDFPGYDLYTYFTKNISYSFDEKKRAGLELFLKEVSHHNEISALN